MKKTLLILALIFSICGIVANAQSVTIDPKANTTPVFEIKSTTEGMVMPKLTVAQRNVMSGLTAGTQVYCTDCTPYGPYNYDGGSWVAMFQTQTVSPITYTVGQAAQGGIVFWIDPASGGQHGLVAATSDLVTAFGGSTAIWQNSNSTSVYFGAGRKGYYGGAENTKLILNQYDIFSYCREYNENSYGDWYLPAIDELVLMYSLRNIIGNFSVEKNYWSSTELQSGYALAVDFSNGNIVQTSRGALNRGRAVRRF